MAVALAKIVASKTWVLAVLLTLTLFSGNSAQAVDLTGCWSGTWESCTTGHHGPLNANFSRCNDTQYNVVFSGRFFKIFPFRYTVTLDVIQEGDVVVLSGSSYLGRMFGTFTYSAQATACEFHSTYNSCKDNGLFNLTRCTAPVCCQ